MHSHARFLPNMSNEQISSMHNYAHVIQTGKNIIHFELFTHVYRYKLEIHWQAYLELFTHA